MEFLTVEIQKNVFNIATGFTTAFLGDERTLREFIVGDFAKKEYEADNKNTILFLINDNYDPLNFRQLRIGVNKDEKLIEKFKPYCGKPIAEIPDPFECHSDYSSHFESLLLKRLGDLDIYPTVIDSYQSYKKGMYSELIRITFENYHRIKEILTERFKNFTLKNLFRIQCPECLNMDEVHISNVVGHVVSFHCNRCGSKEMDYKEINGKLSWKLDCAARWNIYDIDLETFSKAHMAELGSFEVSKFISEKFYGGKVPSIIRYGDVNITKDLSSNLIKTLPPQLLKKLMVSDIVKDINITKEYIENFCNREEIRPGISYSEYIKRELPKKALICNQLSAEERQLVEYSNQFSKCFYGKEYGLTFPDPSVIKSAAFSTIQSAYNIIGYTLSIREELQQGSEEVSSAMKNYLSNQNIDKSVYPYMRKLFCQSEGPSIITLLSILPKDYLMVIFTVLKSYFNYVGFREEEKHEVNQEPFDNAFTDSYFHRM